MSLSLEGRCVVVTGSTRGLGLAFARDLAAHGASVVVNGVDPARCAAAVADLEARGAQVVAQAGSVADEQVVDRLVDAALTRFGRLDAVVNNAGITRDARIGRQTPEDFDAVIAVHLRGTWLMTRRALATKPPDGLSVVNVTSGSSLYGLTGQSNYAAAKGGVNALTRALTVELHDRGCRVNAVYPRARTDMTTIVEAVPAIAEHLGQPEDVAPLVSYLASPASHNVRGQLLAFDGRELTVWSHPQPVASRHHSACWSDQDIHAALSDDAMSASLNPDAIGLASWEAFGGYR